MIQIQISDKQILTIFDDIFLKLDYILVNI